MQHSPYSCLFNYECHLKRLKLLRLQFRTVLSELKFLRAQMYTTNPQHFIYSQTIRIVLQQITCELSYKRVRATKAQIATKIVQSKYELRMK